MIGGKKENRLSSLLILSMFLLSSILASIIIIPTTGSSSMVTAGPTSVITRPTNNSVLLQLTSIQGTASVANNTTITKVEICLTRLSDNKYWDGWNWNNTQIWLQATGTWSWYYNTNSVTWTTDTSYLVQSKATDGLSRVETPKYGKVFTINFTNPYSTIIMPQNYAILKSLNFIYGTAGSYLNNNITKVEISIHRHSDNHYWNQTGWTNVSQIWLLTNGTTSWNYISSSVNWETGWYLIRSRATDNKSNVEIPSHYPRIYIDKTAPVSSISSPINGSSSKRVLEITGSASDMNGSGIKTMEVLLKRTADNYYWDGSVWVVNLTWVNVQFHNYSYWIYDTSKIYWQNGSQYLVRSRATDHLNNVETPAHGNLFNITQNTFYSTIAVPIHYRWYNALNEIKGYTNYDNQSINITKVEIRIRRISDNRYWSGSNWTISKKWLQVSIWVAASGQSHWSYNSSFVTLTNGTSYRVQSRAYNNKSDIEIPSSGNLFRIDKSIPYSKINYPLNNSKLDKLLVINGMANDPGSTGILMVRLFIKRLSDNHYWTGSRWYNQYTWVKAYLHHQNSSKAYWLYNTTHILWSNGTYIIQAQAIDKAYNFGEKGHGNVIIIGTPKLSSSITSPYNNSILNKLITIKGKASAGLINLSISKVEILITRLNDNYTWNGTNWTLSMNWLTVSGKYLWSYNSSKVQLTNELSYKIQSRATDNKSKVEIPSYGNRVKIDTTIPYSNINHPQNNTTLNELSYINGTSNDPDSSGIYMVRLYLQRLSDNKYWTGSYWSNYYCVLYSNVNQYNSTSAHWHYTITSINNSINWLNNTKYLIRSQAVDKALNFEKWENGNIFTIIFSSGTPPGLNLPTSNIIYPANNSIISPPSLIYGTAKAYGNASLSFVQICIMRLSDYRSWSGSTWVINQTYWLSTSGTTSWQYNSTNVAWKNGTKYLVRSRATDNKQKVEAPSHGDIFTVMINGSTPPGPNPPISNISYPTNNSVISPPSTIHGIAKAYGNASLSFVEISIMRLSDYRYWSGFAWVINQTYWLATSGTTTWQYSCTNVTWTNGTKYLVRSRATDNKQKVETPSHGNVFTIKSGGSPPPQSLKPTSTITSPSNNSYLKSLSSITGTASTPSNNTTVSKVEILIESNNYTWNGNNWTLTQTWLLATGTTSWSYNTNSVSWSSGNWYLIRSRATDNQSNIELPSYGNRFMIDNTPPSSSISSPKNNTISAAIIKISGTAKDFGGSWISHVDITILRLSDGFYWSGSAWTNSTVWIRATGKSSWQYHIGNASIWTYNYTYLIRSRATDRAGNVETPSHGNLYNYRIVPHLPWSYITSPSNNSYLNKLTLITGKAYSNLNYSHITNVSISIKRLNDNKYWSGSGWINSNTWILATGTSSWSYSTSSVSWSSNNHYIIQSRATDNRSQVEKPRYGNKFLIDMIIPSSSITNPVNNTTLKTLSFINGTATDSGGAGLIHVQISLRRLSDNKYWDGHKWNSSINWFTVLGKSSWYYNTNQSMWTDNTQYLVRSRAMDNANNLETPSHGKRFTIKWIIKRPTSSINSPSNNSNLNSLKLISGGAVDYSGSGLKRVEIIIKNLNTSKYWTGATWSGSQTWLKVSGTTSWSYNTSTVNWSTATYLIRSKATDNKNNIELPSHGTVVNLDLTKPSSSIKIPSNNLWLKALEYINGTSSDNVKSRSSSGVAKVEISIYREVNKRYWDGSKWVENKTWLLATGTTVWYYDCSNVKWYTHNKFIIRSRAIDNAGNVESPSSGNVFNYKNVPPKGLSISIENGRKLTNIPFVKIKLKFEDALMMVNSNTRSTGGYEMSLSLDGVTWTDWEPFSDTSIIQLPVDDGKKYVHFRVRDQAGNIGGPVFDTIILDSTPPTDLGITINDNAIYTGSELVNLELFAFDAIAGINNMSFSFDRITWSAWEPYNQRSSITLPMVDGETTVYFRVSDLAENIAKPVSAMITLDTTPPEDLEIIINNNAKYTNSQIIDLKLSAVDSLSGLEQMSFSFDGSTWTTWEQFGTSKLLILPGFEGQHNVYLQVKDLAGNTANSYESIILDTTSPSSLLIEINNHDTETASTTVTLTLNAVDELSGISTMAFSVDKISWSSWETFSNSKSFELSTGDGTKFVYFIVKDYADNVAEPTFDSIYLNTKPQVGDSDEDGYPDDVDAFPNDPAASLDSDSDGSPDHWNTGKSEVDSITYLHLDAFPDDPAASIDSDGDNYPDRWNPGKSRFDSETGLILDAYPDNPDKHQKDAQEKTIETEFMFVILIMIVLTLLVVLIASFVHRNKSQRQLRENVEDKILKKLRYEILNDEIPGDPELTDADLINRLELDYSHGEISDETYQYIKNRIMNEKI